MRLRDIFNIMFTFKTSNICKYSKYQISKSPSTYRENEKYATGSVHYQNKIFFGNPFYEFKL